MKSKKRLDSELRNAARIIRGGGVVACPTETSYGLACDPRSVKAVKRIFRIKGRDASKALPLIASSVSQVKHVAELSGLAEQLTRLYWPGPFTLVLPKRGKLAAPVVKDGTIAIRVSSSEVARSLARRVGCPIVATSLNRSGEPAVYDITDVAENIRNELDAIIDIGKLPQREASTIVRVDNDEVTVLRKGVVKI